MTERLITEAVWLADSKPKNALYIMPTSKMVSDLVQARVDDPISQSEYLATVTGRFKKILAKQADKIGLKRLSQGYVYFRGSQDETQIISVDSDANFMDEIDRMPQKNMSFFNKRLGNSTLKWERSASTPTYPNFGIDKMFSESSQGFYVLRCSSCNKRDTLDYPESIDAVNKRLICKHCKKPIVPWQCEGQWVHKYPKKSKRGYHISALYSPALDITGLLKDAAKTSETEKQQFYNQRLGLPYEPQGARITQVILDACRRSHISGLLPTYRGGEMGVDVGTVLNVVIGKDDKIVRMLEIKTFSELGRYMELYDIKTCVIDALPETRKAKEFADKYKGRVFLCYYDKQKMDKDGIATFDRKAKVVHTNRTAALDELFDLVLNQKVALPKNANEIVNFYPHLQALIRVVEENTEGNKVAVYQRSGADHYAHAMNYWNIARKSRRMKPGISFM